MICLYNHFHIDEREGTAYTNSTWCVTTDDKRILKISLRLKVLTMKVVLHKELLSHR
jgi:hypothetical protein